MKLRIMALLFGISYLADGSFGQWVQWGGPNQDFISNAKGLAPSWPEEGPRKLWKRDLGEGYSAILVDGDRLYTMHRTDGREGVVALNTRTGKTEWDYRYAADPEEGHVKQFGEGPRSTPVISGDRIYTIGVSGVMHCLNKSDGKVIWSHKLWKEFGGNVLNHGYASSPIAYKDSVIALVGGENQSIVAFDKYDGHVLWKNLSYKNSYSTPKIIKVDGEEQLVTFMAKEIIGVDPNNGELKWRYAHENQWGQNVSMPVWDGKSDTLFFSTTGAGARGLKLKREGTKTETEELWSTRKIQFYHVTAVGIDDFVYGSTGAMAPNFLSAINIKTGKIAWRKRGFAKACCLYADGRLIILDEDGKLALATATPEDLKVHSSFALFDDVSWTVPTVVGNKLYARDKGSIVALDLG